MQQIKKIIRLLGFEITRSRSERRTLFQAVKHLKSLGFKPELVIDAGVATGTAGIYENYPDSKVLLIEPLKEYKKSVDELYIRHWQKFILYKEGISKMNDDDVYNIEDKGDIIVDLYII